MTRIIIIFALIISNAATVLADSRCIPFFRNFTAEDYNAHNRNYDVVCDNYGNVFVANFEGLLHYDGAAWHTINTPGISRVTSLARDNNGRIWVGGFNIFGYLTADIQGRLVMKTLASDLDKTGIGEVNFIKVSGDKIYVHTTNGKAYRADGNKLHQIKVSAQAIKAISDSVKSLHLPTGCVVSFAKSKGIFFKYSSSAREIGKWSSLTENDGLISNMINYITFDNSTVWGATDKGIFGINATSPYGQLTSKQGLKGEVNCISQLNNLLYVGTTEGLFKIDESGVIKITDNDMTCWQFDNINDDKILAATTFGVYYITSSGIRQLNNNHTLSLCMGQTNLDFYTGELNYIYHNDISGKRKVIANIGKVTKLSLTHDALLAETIYGQLWQISLKTGKKKCLRQKADPNSPKVNFTDAFGTTWKTDGDGYNLTPTSRANYAKHLKLWTNSLSDVKVNSMIVTKNGEIWVGGEFGLILLDSRQLKYMFAQNPDKPYIREILSLGDSVIWGGFGPGMKPLTNVTDINLPSNCRKVVLRFSISRCSFVKPVLYRYRINDGRWTVWSEETEVVFNNVSSGKTKVEIEAKNLFGKTSDISTVVWNIEYPFYQRWYANIFYGLLISLCIWQFLRWRTRKLKHDKQRLEEQVTKRTSELSDALYDLKNTQKELVRMERTATAGKLTQGLIDRILNPINYINNFSKLTTGLAKDLKEDIDDEKENMSEDNYEDCEDILGMMSMNLQKIEEHGTNTTRTLRAMEAMLNNHIGTRNDHDIVPLCHQAIEVSKEHFAKEIAECNITISEDTPDTPVIVSIDQEAISKVLVALISNSIYYVAKKYHQTPYDAKVSLVAKPLEDDSDHRAIIIIRDNGCSIDDSVKDKIFDPFFTTKTTGEASGIGLYLARELIQDHNGTISVDSKKDEYFQMTITI